MAHYSALKLRPHDVVVVEAYIERYPHHAQTKKPFTRAAAANQWRYWRVHFDLHAVSVLLAPAAEGLEELEEEDFNV